MPGFARHRQAVAGWHVNHYEIALQVAQGDVAVVGYRDGTLTDLLAANDAVERVTVYSDSTDAVMMHLLASEKPGGEKISLYPGDPRDTLRGRVHDFLYVDTYPVVFDDDVVRDIELFGDNNNIGEYWFRGFEFVLLAGLAHGLVSLYDLPSVLGEYLERLQGTEEARTALGCSDVDYSTEVLTALSESCASSLDLIV